MIGWYRLLDQEDIEKLSSVLGEECARKLMERWRENAKEASVMAFLDSCGADVRLAARVLRYWPDRTVEKLRENPYRLLFLVGWPAADRIAHSLGMGAEDHRRLTAAVRVGHLYAASCRKRHAGRRRGPSERYSKAASRLRDLRAAQRAIKMAVAEGSLVGDERTGYQAFGCAVMERSLAAKFQTLLSLQGAEPDQGERRHSDR